MKRPAQLHALAILLCLAAPAAWACDRIELAAPARLQTLADRQPMLVWRGEATQRYRVQVAALLPEARLVSLHDVEVLGPRWRLPEPLPVARASLKVVVSRHCPSLDTQDLLAQGPWFFVDVQRTCAIDAGSLQVTEQGLRWSPVANAQRYSVGAFDARSFVSGEALAPLFESDVREPHWPATHAARGGMPVWTIQAMCDGQWGRPVAWSPVHR